MNPTGSKTTASAAEQQMRSWALGLEVKDRLEHAAAVKQLPKEIHNYISISREAGAGGGEVSRRLGQKLGWQVLDKELLDYMAEHYKMPRDLLDFVDESTSNWFHEVFGNWLDSHLVTQSEYVSRMGRIVLIAARHEHSVFVGRGAQFVLPPNRGVAIRLVAPREKRIRTMMQRHGIDHDAAAKKIKTIDAGRREFVQRYFQRKIDDPLVYDMVLNMGPIDEDTAAEMIANYYQRRFKS